ncbi:ECF transporter S component, partial [Clostridioides difficile]|nr:ECF transporter S component [Clostridioides difficile]
GNNFLINVIGICVSSIWMLFGYYITEVILYGNFIVPLTSIPGNLMQVLIGLIIALPISKVLKKCIK